MRRLCGDCDGDVGCEKNRSGMGRGKGGICVPSPWGAAGTRAMDSEVVVVGVGGIVLEEGEGDFQKLEEFVGLALTTSLLLSGMPVTPLRRTAPLWKP